MEWSWLQQPRADDWDGVKALFEKSSLPLIADESCVAEKDVEKCAGHFHGIAIKRLKAAACSGKEND
jgi:hypothetical protein